MEPESEEVVNVVPRPPVRDRMTVVDKVYHQPMNGGDAFCCETTFERWLDSDESIYSRRSKVGEEWKALHFGWFTDEGTSVGMLVLRNDVGRNPQVIPSDEEKSDLSQMGLEIGFHDLPLFVVPPGESMRAVPSGEQLYVRCLGGECSFTVFAFPK